MGKGSQYYFSTISSEFIHREAEISSKSCRLRLAHQKDTTDNWLGSILTNVAEEAIYYDSCKKRELMGRVLNEESIFLSPQGSWATFAGCTCYFFTGGWRYLLNGRYTIVWIAWVLWENSFLMGRVIPDSHYLPCGMCLHSSPSWRPHPGVHSQKRGIYHQEQAIVYFCAHNFIYTRCKSFQSARGNSYLWSIAVWKSLCIGNTFLSIYWSSNSRYPSSTSLLYWRLLCWCVSQD